MRIADKMNFEQVKSSLAKNRTEMAELQNQAATQKRVTKPSDDPLAATRILQTRSEISSVKQFLKSANQARSFLEYSEQSLGELSELLMRAKEIALSQASEASSNANTRTVAAAEIEQVFSQAVQVGNRKLGDRFLFGGFRTNRPPFDPNGRYFGDGGEMRIAINKDARVAMNVPGSRVFLGRSVEVSNADIRPSAPTREGERPRALPESLSAPDPSVTPLRGPASVDSAAYAAVDSAVDAAVDSNDAEVSSRDGAPKMPGGVNLFKVLNDLETGLRANSKESVQDSLDLLDEALNQVVLARSELGSRVSTINSTFETLQKSQLDAKALASNLEDVDTFELVSDINRTESTLKAALETSGKLIQPSLLDFLR